LVLEPALRAGTGHRAEEVLIFIGPLARGSDHREPRQIKPSHQRLQLSVQEQEPGAAVPEDVLDLGTGQPMVDGHQDSPGGRDSGASQAPDARPRRPPAPPPPPPPPPPRPPPPPPPRPAAARSRPAGGRRRPGRPAGPPRGGGGGGPWGAPPPPPGGGRRGGG